MRSFLGFPSKSFVQLKDQKKRKLNQKFEDKPDNANNYDQQGSCEIRYCFQKKVFHGFKWDGPTAIQLTFGLQTVPKNV